MSEGSMALPHNFTREYVAQAIDIWHESVAEGRLVPVDAYDVVTSFAGNVARGESVPTTFPELLLAVEAIQLVPIMEGDHK